MQHAVVLGGGNFQFRQPKRGNSINTSSCQLRLPNTQPQSPSKDLEASSHATPYFLLGCRHTASWRTLIFATGKGEEDNLLQHHMRFCIQSTFVKKQKKSRKRETLAGREEQRELQFCGGIGCTSLGGKS